MQYNIAAMNTSTLTGDGRYRIFLVVLALLGLVLVLLTTYRYGAGVSSDAVRAMSTAEGLSAGKGFVDFVGSGYVHWPPLYPLVLAGLSLLTGLDVFHAGWYLNIILFPVNIWLWGVLFRRVFSDKPVFAWFASLVALLSSSMLRIYANVASDPLFVTFMLVFFLGAGRYLESPSSRLVWLMFIAAGLAMLQRYLGVALFAVGGLVVLLKVSWRGILKALPVAILCFLPSAAWLFFHNYLGYDTLFGPRSYDQMWPLENISLSLTKILHWFLPYAPGLQDLLLKPWTILLPTLLVLIIINSNHRENWTSWTKALAGRYVWPGLLFSVIYYFLLAFTVNTIDHRDLTSDRYYVIILPVILILLCLTLEHLVVARLEDRKPIFRAMLAGAALLWLAYPAYDLQEYLRAAWRDGEPSNYNIYNSRFFNEMELVDAGRAILRADPQAVIYSNYVNALWFQYRRPIHVLLPVDNELPQEQRIALLEQNYPGWPGDETGYIIWFTPNEYKYLASPVDLSLIARLELIYRDAHGEIYRVAPE